MLCNLLLNTGTCAGPGMWRTLAYAAWWGPTQLTVVMLSVYQPYKWVHSCGRQV